VRSTVFRPRVFRLDVGLDPGACLARLRGRRGLVLLDGATGGPALLAFDPVGVPFELGTGTEGAWVAALARQRDALRLEAGDPIPGPFHGGFLGALAYDLGASGERAVDSRPPLAGLPATTGGSYVDFLVRERADGPWWLVLGDGPLDGRAELEARRGAVERELAGPDPKASAGASTPVRLVSAAEHRRRIAAVRERIAAGDVYQVNLAHPLACATRGDPIELYRALRRVNPAPYMGYCSVERGGRRVGALLSASPELLLEFDGELLRTRPIKGTAPRGATPAEDRALALRLLASEKDRAELAMIVDLERNDLGRIAVPGGVRVEPWPRLESYARVHHLVADVVARPRAGIGALEALASLFPGGSVTGAPKLAAMRAIAELEGHGRGYFTGALGYLDTRGRAAFNLLIRTLEWRPSRPGGPDPKHPALLDPAPGATGGPWDGELVFQVGGGITWSSDPAAEDEETLAKARGLIDSLAALGG
jgi:para-aminobenzoate synthetase component 1